MLTDHVLARCFFRRIEVKVDKIAELFIMVEQKKNRNDTCH